MFECAGRPEAYKAPWPRLVRGKVTDSKGNKKKEGQKEAASHLLTCGRFDSGGHSGLQNVMGVEQEQMVCMFGWSILVSHLIGERNIP